MNLIIQQIFFLGLFLSLRAQDITLSDPLPSCKGFQITSSTGVARKFGYGVDNGDINNDGIPDMIVSEYLTSGTSTVYVVYGTNTGYSDIEVSTMTQAQGFKVTGLTLSSDDSPNFLSAAGDVDGDGIKDLVIGAGGTSSYLGAVYVIYGKTGGYSDFDVSTLTSDKGFKIISASGGRLGWSLNTKVDINGDKINDIIAGANTYGTGAKQGAVYVIYGQRARESDLTLTTMPTTRGFQISGSANYFFRATVTSAGDFNQDYVDDLFMAGPGANSFLGMGYVLYGKNGSFSDFSISSMTTSQCFTLTGQSPIEKLSLVASDAGDFNNDGVSDIVMSAWNAASSKGYALIYYGKKGGPPDLGTSVMTASEGFKINGVTANDQFGSALSSIMDIDGDGITDLLIGAKGFSSSKGALYVIFGREDQPSTIDLSTLTSDQGFRFLGSVASGLLGSSVRSLGDINQDGVPDFIVGAPGAGRAYVLYGPNAWACDTCDTASTCQTCLSGYNYMYNGLCYKECPSFVLFQFGNECFAECPTNAPYYFGYQCYTGCPGSTPYNFGFECFSACPVSGPFEFGSECFAECPTNAPYNFGYQCNIACPGNALYNSGFECFIACPADAPYNSGFECFAECPTNAPYYFGSQCYTGCPGSTPYNFGFECFSACPVLGPYELGSECFAECPTNAPYNSGYQCDIACSGDAPYHFHFECFEACPVNAPYEVDNECFAEDPNAGMSSKLKSIVKGGGTATNTAMKVLNLWSPTSAFPFIYGQLKTSVLYMRYLNISRTQPLEDLYQLYADTDTSAVPFITLSDSVKDSFPVEPLPYMFRKYELPSSFIANWGDDLMGLAIIFGLLIATELATSLLKKQAQKIRGLKTILHRASITFQNFLVGNFGEAVGPITFYITLEFRNKSKPISSILDCLCLILGLSVVGLCFLILRKFHAVRKNFSSNETLKEENFELLEKKYEKIAVLFDEFDNSSFINQSAFLLYNVKAIVESLFVGLGVEQPLVQAIFLLLLTFVLLAYSIFQKSFKSKLDLLQHFLLVLSLFIVNFCLTLMAGTDITYKNFHNILQGTSQTIFWILFLFQFIPLIFFAIGLIEGLKDFYKWLSNLRAKRNLNAKRPSSKLAQVHPTPTSFSAEQAVFSFNHSRSDLKDALTRPRLSRDQPRIFLLDLEGSPSSPTNLINSQTMSLSGSPEAKILLKRNSPDQIIEVQLSDEKIVSDGSNADKIQVQPSDEKIIDENNDLRQSHSSNEQVFDESNSEILRVQPRRRDVKKPSQRF